MVGSLVILYLFLGGLGAAVVFVEVLWSWQARCHDKVLGQQTPYIRQRSLGLLLGLFLLILGCACLVFDLERPDRALFVLLRPTFSILSIGSYLLMVTIGLAAVMTWLSYKQGSRLESMRCFPWLAALVLIACFCVMAYTGVYLASTKSVAIWNTPLLPLLFVTSSLSCGLSAVFLVNLFVQDGWRLRDRLHGWRGFHVLALVVEVLALVAYGLVMAFNTSAHESVELLLSPAAYGIWFVGGVGLLGLAVPLCGEAFEFFINGNRAFPAVHILCILGGFLLRFCLVSVGLH